MKTSLNLNKELEKIVDEYVEYYKEDLEQDIVALLDKNKISDNFIFLVRNSGTHLYEKEKLFVNEAGERGDFLYFRDSFLKGFEVNISKRAKKYVYGDIKEISVKNLIKDINEKSKSYDKVNVKILKTDNSICDSIFLTDDSYTESLRKNELSYDDIEKVYYLNFFN